MARLFVLLLVLGLFPWKLAAEKDCPKDEYYDSVTRSCASCHDICANAELQRTVALCNEKCPGYPSAYMSKAMPSKSPSPGSDQHKKDIVMPSKSPPASDRHNKDIIIAICVTFLICGAFAVLVYLSRMKLRAHCLPSNENNRNSVDIEAQQNPNDNDNGNGMQLDLIENEHDLYNHQPQEPYGPFKVAPSGRQRSFSPARFATEDDTNPKRSV